MKLRCFACAFCLMSMCLLFVERTARAEDGATRVDLHSRLDRAQGMRIAGIVNTSVGLAVATVGMGFLIDGTVAFATMDPESPTMGGAFPFLFSAITFSVAAVFLAVGIPLWSVGSYRRARMREGMARLPVPTLSADPSNSTYAFGLTWAL